MNRLLLSFVSLVVGASPALACMNDYKPNVAAIERSRSVREQLQKHIVKEPWEARRDRLRKLLTAGGDYRVKNDLATALAHTGEAAEAVSLLEQVEAEKPGLYMTAANLGTAYELAGDNRKALEWIRRGIERNAEAHEGTEWLHVRILEAKLALNDDPEWLESNSISGLRKNLNIGNIRLKVERLTTPYSIPGQQTDLNTVESSATGNRGEKLSIDQVKAALMYQLHERLQFVNPPDAIVGALLLDLGDLLGREPAGVGGALDVFKLADAYLDGLPNVSSLQDSVAKEGFVARRGQLKPSDRNDAEFLGYLTAIGVPLAILVISLKRRIQRRRTAEKAPRAL